MEKIKCITFDKEAQDSLPEHIKLRMKEDREKARSEQKKAKLTDKEAEEIIDKFLNNKFKVK